MRLLDSIVQKRLKENKWQGQRLKSLAAGGPAIKSGGSFMTAWAPLQIYRKYFVLTSETTILYYMKRKLYPSSTEIEKQYRDRKTQKRRK